MRRIKQFVVGVLLLGMSQIARADEGMWLLSLLNGYTIEDMQSKGFKLTSEDIYSVNQACLKDAVIIFGGGCTGELISADGLLLTNHHCGYGAIQSHSTVENDYLTDGFWAMSREEELPNDRLSVQFLRYMKDVGSEVLEGTEETSSKDEYDKKIESNIQKIVSEAIEDEKYTAYVRPMFYGNQYFLFVYERYNDVRLVGAPPSSIGNFGEDNDNWIWPRHTGDFSMFRIYADKDNKPAQYSPDNVPYKPRKFFEISMDGVKKGDFTMILGYPGSTQQFLYSKALKTMMERSLPLRIELRTLRMNIMDKYMSESDVVRIQYASKYRGVTNAWKKWQGAIKGLERLDAVNKKLVYEEKFNNWVKESPERVKKYGDILPQFEDIYTQMEDYQVVNDLISEAVLSVELYRIASSLRAMMQDSADAEALLRRAEGLYKDYYPILDKEMFYTMLEEYRNNSVEEYYPLFFNDVKTRYKDNFEAFADKAFTKTYFSSHEGAKALIDLYTKNPGKALKKLEKDIILTSYDQFRELYLSSVMPQMTMFDKSLDHLYKSWVQAQFEMEPEIRQYPDANFTMRLTYGEIEGYRPEDAVEFDYYTTLGGIIEKSKEGKHDYVIPAKLKELYETRDYGQYGTEQYIPVCFAASNHTSGGNSGSPVLNADGRLIGINFDRNWHGTMSDEMYDPDMCRNIAVDIRYVLFIIDKFAGAGYLLDEMVLVNE